MTILNLIETPPPLWRGDNLLYLLRKLNSFSVMVVILCRFYLYFLSFIFLSFIESLLSFSFICWFHSLTVKDRNSLNNIVKICSKIIRVKQRDLNAFYNQQIVWKAISIFLWQVNSLCCLLDVIMHYLCARRHSKSFIPSAIRLLNSL